MQKRCWPGKAAGGRIRSRTQGVSGGKEGGHGRAARDPAAQARAADGRRAPRAGEPRSSRTPSASSSGAVTARARSTSSRRRPRSPSALSTPTTATRPGCSPRWSPDLAATVSLDATSDDDTLETLAARIVRRVHSDELVALHRLVIGESARFPELAVILHSSGDARHIARLGRAHPGRARPRQRAARRTAVLPAAGREAPPAAARHRPGPHPGRGRRARASGPGPARPVGVAPPAYVFPRKLARAILNSASAAGSSWRFQSWW